MISKPEAVRVASILEGLDKNPPGAEVFEAFDELDALPADVVRAVLTSVTGPQPAPEQLDEATREAHGFPPPPLVLVCTRASKPSRAEELNRIEQQQLRHAGMMWDGQDLPASQRLAPNGGEASFAGALELKTFSGDGVALFDALLYGQGSGAIFKTGTSDCVGAVAYGVVEMKDKRARVGLQAVLETPPPAAIAKAAIPVQAELFPREVLMPPALAPVAKRPATVKKAVAKKPVAKKAAKKAVAKKPVVKKAVVKKAVAKKAVAKKAVAKKAVVKKAVAKKAIAKKAVVKKAVAKKAVVKKAVVKKAVAKKAVAKKAVAKKAVAKKAVAKKAVAKKAVARKAIAKKAIAKKPVAKK